MWRKGRKQCMNKMETSTKRMKIYKRTKKKF